MRWRRARSTQVLPTPGSPSITEARSLSASSNPSTAVCFDAGDDSNYRSVISRAGTALLPVPNAMPDDAQRSPRLAGGPAAVYATTRSDLIDGWHCLQSELALQRRVNDSARASDVLGQDLSGARRGGAPTPAPSTYVQTGRPRAWLRLGARHVAINDLGGPVSGYPPDCLPINIVE